MSLVEYSDSDSSDSVLTTKRGAKSTGSIPVKKRRTQTGSQAGSDSQSSLPPLPAQFRDLYAVSTRISVQDDPALHGGRRRVTPHVAGNWPTHVYLEWYPTKTEITALLDVISRTKSILGDRLELHSLLYSDLGVQMPLHISLSRPVVLVTEERHSFSASLERAIRDSDVHPFDIRIEGLDWASNFERTRWFLVLRVSRPTNNALNHLLKMCNLALSLYGQPPLYECPSAVQQGDKNFGKRKYALDQHHTDFSHCFHISIAWSLAEPDLKDEARLKSMDLSVLRDIVVHFDSVKVKIGNQILNIGLPSKVIEHHKLTGV
ncbi:hypothetical protein VTO42DRAFT_813 [Malbranchea cinnamomea]